jgi:ribosome-binding protein aMBF1 (putative translation factor)
MSFFFVDPEIYKQYREAVLTLSDSVQINFQEHLAPEERRRGLSDKEIAEKLGLDERTVREIRVVAERDTYDLSEWEKAIEFKDKACRAFARHGISYVFKYRNELK